MQASLIGYDLSKDPRRNYQNARKEVEKFLAGQQVDRINYSDGRSVYVVKNNSLGKEAYNAYLESKDDSTYQAMEATPFATEEFFAKNESIEAKFIDISYSCEPRFDQITIKKNDAKNYLFLEAKDEGNVICHVKNQQIPAKNYLKLLLQDNYCLYDSSALQQLESNISRLFFPLTLYNCVVYPDKTIKLEAMDLLSPEMIVPAKEQRKIIQEMPGLFNMVKDQLSDKPGSSGFLLRQLEKNLS